MDTVTVMFDLDAPTLRALQSEAQLSGEDIGDLVRFAIRHDLYRRDQAKIAATPNRAKSPL